MYEASFRESTLTSLEGDNASSHLLFSLHSSHNTAPSIPLPPTTHVVATATGATARQVDCDGSLHERLAPSRRSSCNSDARKEQSRPSTPLSVAIVRPCGRSLLPISLSVERCGIFPDGLVDAFGPLASDRRIRIDERSHQPRFVVVSADADVVVEDSETVR